MRDQALDVLARLGFPRFEDRGEPFDPAACHLRSGAKAPFSSHPAARVISMRAIDG